MAELPIPEVLAPVGSADVLTAAVQAGADAVYVGGGKFSARAYAENFNEDAMRKAIRYCHLRNVCVYVTINTLIKDDELEDAVKYAADVWDMGADALIIQDVGLAVRLKKVRPEIVLHASTQMGTHNSAGARYYAGLGFQRIVLARELTIPEIGEITREMKKINVETEVFVHGAMCICYSGKCLMSSLIGGRSGNRGRCAQPCRRFYTLEGENIEGYLLSPKDMSLFEYIPQFMEIGVASLKIEGRMRTASYVAEAIDLCRSAIRGDAFDMERMRRIFNREGFNKGFVNIDEINYKDILSINRPGNFGVYLGKIEDKEIELTRKLCVGDGVRIASVDGVEEKGFKITKIERAGSEIKSATAGQRVKIFPAKYHDGDLVYKTFDVEIKEETDRLISGRNASKTEIEAEVHWRAGSPARIGAQLDFLDVEKVEVFGDIVQHAKTAPLSPDRLRDALRKSGDSAFAINPNLIEFGDGFLPIAAINKWRREFISLIEEKQLSYRDSLRMKKASEFEDKGQEYAIGNVCRDEAGKMKLYDFDDIIIVSQKSDVKDKSRILRIAGEISASLGQDSARKHILCVDPFLCDDDGSFIRIEDCLNMGLGGEKYLIRFPSIFRDGDALDAVEFDDVIGFKDAIKSGDAIEKILSLPGCVGLLTDNAGVYEVYRSKGIKDKLLIGDVKLNIMNSVAPKAYPEVDLFVISEELTAAEMARIDNKGIFANLVYGFVESMVTEYPGGDDFESSYGFLTDKTGARFHFRVDALGRRHILNAHIKNNLDAVPALASAGYRHFIVDLTHDADAAPETRGAYVRGVL